MALLWLRYETDAIYERVKEEYGVEGNEGGRGVHATNQWLSSPPACQPACVAKDLSSCA